MSEALKVGKLLYVEWWDHSGHGNTWLEADEIGTGPSLVRSVGWVFDETRTSLTLVPIHAEYVGNGDLDFVPHARCPFTIVKAAIKRRAVLTIPERAMSRGRGKKRTSPGQSKHRKARVQRFGSKHPKSKKIAKG